MLFHRRPFLDQQLRYFYQSSPREVSRRTGKIHPLTACLTESARRRCRGIRFARPIVVLQLDPLAPPTPHLPDRRLGGLKQLATSAALHLTFVLGALIAATSGPVIEGPRLKPTTDESKLEVRHIVFLAPAVLHMGGGGGGGGNRQPGEIRRAQGIGSDPITLRVRKQPPATAPVMPDTPPVVEVVPMLPSIVLDAKPMASGVVDQIGLPASALLSAATGPGSGGGVGSGIGTGIGSGLGPGLGPGSGGGTGGGVHRPGGAVTAPRLIKEVRPGYSNEALLSRIQGTVMLEVIVTSDGSPSQIRVVRSLDRGGLDNEAVAAVAQWRFEPGRLAGTPVDVLVTIVLDFSIR